MSFSPVSSSTASQPDSTVSQLDQPRTASDKPPKKYYKSLKPTDEPQPLRPEEVERREALRKKIRQRKNKGKGKVADVASQNPALAKPKTNTKSIYYPKSSSEVKGDDPQ